MQANNRTRDETPDATARNDDNSVLVKETLAAFDELKGQLPDMDPDELLNILYSLLRPLGSGKRWLLRKTDKGNYVF